MLCVIMSYCVCLLKTVTESGATSCRRTGKSWTKRKRRVGARCTGSFWKTCCKRPRTGRRLCQELICWSVRQQRRHSHRTLQQYQLRCQHCQQLHWLTQTFRHRKRRKDFHKRGGDRNWLACFITYMDNHQKESEGRWQEARQLESEKFSIFKELLKVMKKKQLLVYSKFLEMFLKFLMQRCKNSVDW